MLLLLVAAAERSTPPEGRLELEAWKPIDGDRPRRRAPPQQSISACIRLATTHAAGTIRFRSASARWCSAVPVNGCSIDRSMGGGGRIISKYGTVSGNNCPYRQRNQRPLVLSASQPPRPARRINQSSSTPSSHRHRVLCCRHQLLDRVGP